MAQLAATILDVRARLGPAFTDPPITDEIVQLYLDDTACFVAPLVFGECASQAHAYAAAHCVASSPYAADIAVAEDMTKIVSANANGPASRSFAVPAQDADDAVWALTYWGRKFLEYRKARWGIGSAVVARTGRTARRRCG